jgi:O-6-methylguanine DNA methyltransferase
MSVARAGRSSPGAFARRVLQAVSRIPSGRVATYGDIARLAGRPRAARAVGRIVATAARRGLPYHRVIAAGGAVGGYGSSVAMKVALLRAEGTLVRGRRVLGFAACRWPR